MDFLVDAGELFHVREVDPREAALAVAANWRELMEPPPSSIGVYDAESLEQVYRLDMCEQQCIVCGCTDQVACPGGCIWVAPNLCSRCA